LAYTGCPTGTYHSLPDKTQLENLLTDDQSTAVRFSQFYRLSSRS